MLYEVLSPYDVYRLNVNLLDSSLNADLGKINNLQRADNLLINEAKNAYWFELKELSLEKNYICIMEHIDSFIFKAYCEEFSYYATMDDVKKFIQNYGADQVWFTQYLALLSAKAPEEAAIEIYKNLHDEIGNDTNDNSISGFHPNLFRRLHSLFNIPIFHRFGVDTTIQEETYSCINTLLLSTKLNYLTGAGALFVLEKTIPNQLGHILKRLKDLGVSYEDREFLEIHITLDTDHARRWWDKCIQPYITSYSALEQLLRGIALGISARNMLWEGLYEISSFRKISSKVASNSSY